MTEIKTAQVKGRINEWGSVNLVCGNTYGAPSFVAVEGLTEAEVHEAAALLAKSREVCEWYLSENNHGEYDYCASLCDAEYQMRMPTFCPSCGRKVVVK